nr:hypothetical protein [Shewanella sp. CG12_big_fil_rev_8_21_14_0_65_47_15]
MLDKQRCVAEADKQLAVDEKAKKATEEHRAVSVSFLLGLP